MNDKVYTDQELFSKIVNHSSKNDRIAWNRKHNKLKEMIAAEITPIEEQILELIMRKQPLLDKAMELRDTLVKECVHSREFLIKNEDHILCKFCDAKLKLNV